MSESRPLREAATVSLPQRSRVAVVGREAPKTWADYRQDCLDTYGGGHRTDGNLEAFRHGMETVFNLLEAEFLPAEQCRKGVSLPQAPARNWEPEFGVVLADLIFRAQDLLDWVPVCSPGSSGYMRIEALKTALKKFSQLPEYSCPQCGKTGNVKCEHWAAGVSLPQPAQYWIVEWQFESGGIWQAVDRPPFTSCEAADQYHRRPGFNYRIVGVAAVSPSQAPAEAPAATEGPTQELLQDSLLLASAVCNQADDGIDRGAFILTRAIQVRKALRDRFRLDENEVCIDCGHDACDCPPVATEGPGAPPRDPQAICYDVLLHRLQLAVCDPREAVKGNLPSRAKAVELAIDAVVAQQKAAVPGAGSAAQDARTKLLMKFWVAKHEAGIVDEWEAQEKLSIAALTELLRGETTTHKWEPDFSNGECLGCKTCGVCGTTHQTSVEDAELIDRQYLQICVLKADQDALRQSLSSGDYPLLARHLSREYNFSSQADRDQAMRMGKELFAAGKSAGASSEGAGSAEPTK